MWTVGLEDVGLVLGKGVLNYIFFNLFPTIEILPLAIDEMIQYSLKTIICHMEWQLTV